MVRSLHHQIITNIIIWVWHRCATGMQGRQAVVQLCKASAEFQVPGGLEWSWSICSTHPLRPTGPPAQYVMRGYHPCPRDSLLPLLNALLAEANKLFGLVDRKNCGKLWKIVKKLWTPTDQEGKRKGRVGKHQKSSEIQK